MKDAGLRGLAIDSKYTLVLDREEFIRSADEVGVFIIAILYQ